LDILLQDIANSDAERLLKDHHTVLIDFNESIEMLSYPIALTTIINNLINNSLTHGFNNRQGGNITLAISESKHSETNNIFIEYHDDGIGIKDENLSKVFDPFYTTNMGENSGLGLHISHNLIINQFGGSIRCEAGGDDEKEGAHFYLSLPKGE